MLEAAKRLEFERAAELRDQIRTIEQRELGVKGVRTSRPFQVV